MCAGLSFCGLSICHRGLNIVRLKSYSFFCYNILHRDDSFHLLLDYTVVDFILYGRNND